MPIGQYGLQSDEQIGQQRIAQGQAMERSGQAIGQAIGNAPAQAIQASGVVLQQRHIAQQMQDEHVQAQSMLQMHEFQKQELAQKMLVTQQMQQLEAQKIANDAARFQLSKEQMLFERQHLQNEDATRAAQIHNAMGPFMTQDGKIRVSRFDPLTHQVQLQDFSPDQYQRFQEVTRSRMSPEEEAARTDMLKAQAEKYRADAADKNFLVNGFGGSKDATNQTPQPPAAQHPALTSALALGAVSATGNSEVVKKGFDHLVDVVSADVKMYVSHDKPISDAEAKDLAYKILTNDPKRTALRAAALGGASDEQLQALQARFEAENLNRPNIQALQGPNK